MFLVGQPFEGTFDFARARTAPYRSAVGPATAGVDEPRFDHLVDGQPRGLLIEGPTEASTADVLAIKAGGWEGAGGTVLHHHETPEGQVRRRAYHTLDPRGTVDACLLIKGWHRLIGFVPLILAADENNQVVYRDVPYDLSGRLLVEDGVTLSHGSGAILEGQQ